MKRLWMLGAALLVLLAVGLIPVLSQDMGGDEPSPEEAWKKAQEPGEAHKLLAKMAGDWDMNFKMWMAKDTPPVEMKMSTSIQPRFGGRFMVGEYEMTEGPFPHKGATWFGHDNSRKKYQWIRITDMDTAMRVYEGEYDEKAKAVITHASYSMDWQGQTFDVKERNVWKFLSDDQFTMEVLTSYGGEPEIKEVEITYTRAKPVAPATQDPHGILKKLQGDFSVDMKIWMGPEPIVMTAPLTYNWTLDGQAIVMEYDASDMEAMPHKGVEYISYNEVTGEYDSIRMVSTSGAMTVWSGRYDPATKTLEFKADISGVMNGEKFSGKSRAVYKWESDNKYTAVVYTKYDGAEEEAKEVEMTFTRK